MSSDRQVDTRRELLPALDRPVLRDRPGECLLRVFPDGERVRAAIRPPGDDARDVRFRVDHPARRGAETPPDIPQAAGGG